MAQELYIYSLFKSNMGLLPRPSETRKALTKDIAKPLALLEQMHSSLTTAYANRDEPSMAKYLEEVVAAVAAYEESCSHVKLHAKPKPKAKGKAVPKAKSQ